MNERATLRHVPRMNAGLSALFARRSVRAYRDERISEDLVGDLLEAAMAAPSACARDPWRFVVIRRRDTLERIAGGLPNGKMLATADVGVVICGDLTAAHGRELSYLLQDCSAAIENLLLGATMLGIGACWLGVHPRSERVELLRSVLGVPEHVLPVSCVALGWPAEQPAPRTRYDAARVHRERWGE